jgi:hypothetical protein
MEEVKLFSAAPRENKQKTAMKSNRKTREPDAKECRTSIALVLERLCLFIVLLSDGNSIEIEPLVSEHDPVFLS